VLAGAVLSGCVTIKSQTASQRMPGVATLNLQICVSDRDASTYTTCVPGPGNTPAKNTAEDDNGTDGDTTSGGQPVFGDGQLLVGFRVPDGTAAPSSFPSSDGRMIFSSSPGYTSALTAEYLPIAGFHWVGYLSTQFSFDVSKDSNRFTTVAPEFVLPPGSDGGPFASPFRWRAVVGSRQISASFPGTSPIDCPVGTAGCFDSPRLSTTSGRASIPGHLSLTVSDFAVIAPAAVTAGQGSTATITFPLKDSDAAIKGAPTLSITAGTNIPGSQPQVGVGTIAIPANGSTSATVSVPVPPGTALGTYDVTLTATGNSNPAGAAVSRSATAKVTVADALAPAIRISTPANGATVTQGQAVTADYGCTDEFNGSGVASCAGPVPTGGAIDTSAVGPHTFTVSASDAAGNTSGLSTTYTVAPRPTVQGADRTAINFGLAFNFSASTNKATKFTSIQVKNVPAGATVSVTCKGNGCPSQKLKGKRKPVAFTKKNAPATVALKPWAKASLPVGTVLTVTVTKPATTGMVKKLTVRARKAPSITTSCLKPGAKKPTRC
jgi:hypothetical protein